MADSANRRRITLEVFLAAVKEDIRRELRLAGEYIDCAGMVGEEKADRAGGHLPRLAAHAMCRATALAAEVLAAGEIPPAGARSGRRMAVRWPAMEQCRARLDWALRHYRRRLWTARKLGLFRFAGTLLEIVRTTRSQLAEIERVAM